MLCTNAESEWFTNADFGVASQVALQKLARVGLGSIAEACDSIQPFLVGYT